MAAVATLVLIPLASMAVWYAFIAAKGPFWLGLNLDPDYAYLLNSVNVARGLIPGHVDHPGTAVQLFGAAVVRAVHALSGVGDLAEDVVRRPELYLGAIQGAFLVLLAASSMVLGFSVRAATGRTSAAILAQLTPLLSATIPAHLACVKPEPVLLSLSALAAALTMMGARNERARSSVVLALGLGLVCGAALAAKITAAPLLLLPLILLSGRRALVTSALATVLAASLLTRPAWPAMRTLFRLTKRIATHSGQYGSGLPGLLEPGAYTQAVLRLLASEPFMSAGIAAGVLAVAVDRRQPAGGWLAGRRALVAVLAAQTGCLLLVARHPYNEYLVPGVYYLFPGLALTGGALALAYALLAPRMVNGRWRAAAALAVAGFVAHQISSLESSYRRLVHLRDLQFEISRRAQQRYPGRVVFFYRSSSQAYALRFGDELTGMRYRSLIAEAHPQAIFYNLWSGELYPAGALPRSPGAGGQPPFAMQGSPLRRSQIAQFPSAARPTLVYENQQEALYELRMAGTDDPPSP